MKYLWWLLFLFSSLVWANEPTVNPSAVGWGNLLVPGLGATLRNRPYRGLLEATFEIGTFYGGTYYAKESAVTVDGTVLVPDSEGKNVSKPLLGHFLQEWGIKLHMYNTFYHYQQASLNPELVESQKAYQQPLYTGSVSDLLIAPFKAKNLLTAWTYLPVIATSGYLFYNYRHQSVVQKNYKSNNIEETFYGLVEGVTVPLGSAFSEEALYRGFILRELRYYTQSAPLAVGLQSLLFTFSHSPKLRPGALIGGVYFALMVNHFDGNLEQATASHFWIDLVSAGLNYFTYRKIQGKSVPFSVSFSLPFSF